MHMLIPVIAILDIGKTNKKCLLFNEQYEVVFEKSISIKEIVDEDGEVCEDIVALSKWATHSIQEILSNESFIVKAINFSAYGASFMYIDDLGNPLTPLYNYLKTYPQVLLQEFESEFNEDNLFYIQTASPKLESLNAGLQVYRLQKEQPLIYEKVVSAMHLPQYISFLFTYNACADITSIGCHTALWDFTKQNYHEWVSATGIEKKLAPIASPNKTDTVYIHDNELQVGIGLHDSSAALIPYLKSFQVPFILISTGTWSISLNPFNNSPLTSNQLENDCLCYMSYTGNPVKAARLFAGYEHEQAIARLSSHYNKPLDYYKSVILDIELIAKYNLNEFDKGIQVGVNPSGFSKKDITQFSNYESAYHDLMIEIIKQQFVSTSLVLNKEVEDIYVDGGFSNNSIYMSLLASMFPTLNVYAAMLPQSSARGAAMVIHEAWNSQAIPKQLISLKAYEAIQQ